MFKALEAMWESDDFRIREWVESGEANCRTYLARAKAIVGWIETHLDCTEAEYLAFLKGLYGDAWPFLPGKKPWPEGHFGVAFLARVKVKNAEAMRLIPKALERFKA